MKPGSFWWTIELTLVMAIAFTASAVAGTAYVVACPLGAWRDARCLRRRRDRRSVFHSGRDSAEREV